MIKIKLPVLLLVVINLIAVIAYGQNVINRKKFPISKDAESFSELKMTKIAGAPNLGVPVLIYGSKKPIVGEGMGLAAPAWYDWDGDGTKDLLIGEFGSGMENGKVVGNFIRVYKNSGTQETSLFTDKFDYARPPFKLPGNGTPYSVSQFCCIGFTPQFIDLNNDGYLDMITGSYWGEVYWFKGSNQGFEQAEPLPQEIPKEGDPRNGEIEKKAHQYYWIYSSASFGDFTGDGKPDLIVGGMGSLRISENIGTASNPKFGKRQLLLDINEKPLKVYDYNTKELKQFEKVEKFGYTPYKGGDPDLSPYVIDWDNDGILDLLVTNSYSHKGLATIDFFKGVKTATGSRFQQAIALFTVNDGKAFPGASPRINVGDFNNDGINDLFIGVAVVLVKNKFNDQLSWQWQEDNGIESPGKNAAIVFSLADLPAKQMQEYKKSIKLPTGMSIEDYMTIRHQGFIYVMLGGK
jgi:hypothetical protein